MQQRQQSVTLRLQRLCLHVRFMSEQLVPATTVVEKHTQPGSRFVCVGLDALSAADELVEGVSLDLQQVIAKMKQAAHIKYTPGAKFGTENKAALHTYIQVSLLDQHCRHVAYVWTCWYFCMGQALNSAACQQLYCYCCLSMDS